MSKYLIYGLRDPLTNEIRYVGKSCSGLKRPKRHLTKWELETTASHRKTRWIQKLLKVGLRPSIEILEEFTNSEDLGDAEKFWIAQLKGLGFALTNMTIGGEGAVRKQLSQETREKISKANKGRVFSDQHRSALSLAASKKRTPHSHTRRIKARETAQKRAKKIVDDSGRVYDSISEAARQLKVPKGNIQRVLQGKRKSIQGLAFEYLEGDV